MSAYDEFAGRVRGLVISLSGIFTPDECREVEHFIDHDEAGEALITLAWIIVEEDKRIPSETLAAIRDLSRGLMSEKDMPLGLDDHVQGRPEEAL